MARYICYPSTRTERFGIEYGGLFIISTQQRDVNKTIDSLSRISFNTRHKYIADPDGQHASNGHEYMNIYSAMFGMNASFFITYRDMQIGLENYALAFTTNECVKKEYFPVPEFHTDKYGSDDNNFYPEYFTDKEIAELDKILNARDVKVLKVRSTLANHYANSYTNYYKNSRRQLIVGIPRQIQQAFERGYFPNSHINKVGIMFSDLMNHSQSRNISTHGDMPCKLFTQLQIEEPELYNRRVFSTLFPVKEFLNNMSVGMAKAEER